MPPALAIWAKESGALRLDNAENPRVLALQAELAGPLIDTVLILISPRFASDSPVSAVGQRRSLMRNGFLKHGQHGGVESPPIGWPDATAWRLRMQAGPVQQFGGVEIAHSRNHRLVQ
jgi:hypothetical protein